MVDMITQRLYESTELPADIKASAVSVSGTRPYQEDCLMYQVLDDGILGVVCDGMGGLSHGERASACAVDGLLEYFQNRPRDFENMGPYWEEALKSLDDHVSSLKGKDGRPLQGGTTMVAVFLHDNLLSYASAGDSMIYVINDKECKALVRMHNYRMILEQHFKEGRMTEEEFNRQAARGEALISYLGMGGINVWDCSDKPYQLQDGDCVLLCSDGLYKVLSQPQIQSIVAGCMNENFEMTSLELVKNILTGSPKKLDNISILSFWYKKNINDCEKEK